MLKDGPIWRHIVWDNKICEITSWDFNQTPRRLGLRDLKTGKDIIRNGCGWVAFENEVRDVESKDYKDLL